MKFSLLCQIFCYIFNHTLLRRQNMGALEREEELLEEALENGDIDIKQYNREMRWLHEEADGGNDF